MTRGTTFFAILALTLGAMIVGGCARTAPVRNVSDAPISTSDLSAKDVRKAIIQAGSQRGWRMEPQDDGHIQATLAVRDHKAVVDIHYDQSSFDITLRDAEGLEYDADNETIHQNYNGWIQNLERDINNNLAAMQ